MVVILCIMLLVMFIQVAIMVALYKVLVGILESKVYYERLINEEKWV